MTTSYENTASNYQEQTLGTTNAHAQDANQNGERTSEIPLSASQSNMIEFSGTATIVAGKELTEESTNLLIGRGLCPETAAKYGVTSSVNHSGDFIVIPYFDNGILVNNKYRRVNKIDGFNFQMEQGGKLTFWNVDCLRDESLQDEPLIITEGEFDALAAIQCGYLRTVSVPNGSPKAVSQEGTSRYDYLQELRPYLRNVKEIIIASDNDEPGKALLQDLSHRLGRGRCKWVKYPKGCKDLNDALKAYGEKGVQETLKRAHWVKVKGVYKMSELTPEPFKKAYRIGFPVLDKHYNVRLGDFCVLTGVPSNGKTSFLNDMTSRMAQQYGWVTVFGSFEQSPTTDHKKNLRTWFNKKPVKDQNKEELFKADQWIDQFFGFIYPDEDEDATLEWVEEMIRTACVRFNAKIVVVDPWNELDHDRPYGMSLTEYVGFAIKRFKKLAKKYNIHLIVAAHPTKQKRREDGSYDIPDLYDISDSAHWYNKADVGLVIHRMPGETIFRVAKSRYHDSIGMTGDVKMIFHQNICRFDVIDPAIEVYE